MYCVDMIYTLIDYWRSTSSVLKWKPLNDFSTCPAAVSRRGDVGRVVVLVVADVLLDAQ